MLSKKIWIPILIICVATAGMLSIFLISNGGSLQILIKDAPYDDLVSINVDVAAIQVHKTDQPNWISFMEGQEKRLNCSVTGQAERICNSDLSAGTYDIIRIKFNNIRLRYNNGSLYEVDKYENQNQVQNFWMEIPINFTYDGNGGEILFDITVNNDKSLCATVCSESSSNAVSVEALSLLSFLPYEEEDHHHRRHHNPQKDEYEVG